MMPSSSAHYSPATTTATDAPTSTGLYGRIFSNKHSLRTQMYCFFSTAVLVAGSVTLGLCIGLIYSTGHTAYNDADSIIIKNGRSNAMNIAKEIAASIEQQLDAVSSNVALSGSLFAKTLLEQTYAESDKVTPLWKKEKSYREYFFEGPCEYPNCPTDYGEIASRSRIPYMAGFKNGSLLHSSLYLYSSAERISIRNDSLWNLTVTKYPSLLPVIDSLTYLDHDFNTMYNRGLNFTVMYYLSSKVEHTSESPASYHVLHRTYPGILKNNTNYDPSKRSWFTNAPEDSINLYGPYRESFTKQLTVTVSSRKSVVTSTTSVSIISAAVILIKDLVKVLNDITYVDGGFGVLVRSSTSEVLVWGSDSDTYIPEENRFKTVADFDKNLVSRSFSSDSKFVYSDANGTQWMVVCTTFFPSGTSQTNVLSVLVFSKLDDLQFALISLQDNIDSTTTHVVSYTLITVLGSIVVVLILVKFIIDCITEPLECMRKISTDVIAMTTEDDESKDFKDLVHRAFQNIKRNDEVGILSSDYYHVVLLLQEKLEEKQNVKKFVDNPFYMRDDGSSITFETFEKQYCQQMEVLSTDVDLPIQTVDVGDDGLDVLGSLTAKLQAPSKQNSKAPPSALNPHFLDANATANYATVPVVEGDIEREQKPVVARSDQGSNSTSHGRIKMKKISVFNSLATQLWFLSFTLLVGMIIAMVITIILLQNDGQLWMSDSGDDLEASQLVVLQGIATTKAVHVKAFFLQMTLQVMGGAKLFNLLMDKEISKSNFTALPSYSIDAYNPYSSSVSSSYDYSGYFVSTDQYCESSSGACLKTLHSNITELTSLFDLKFKGYNYAGSIFSFAQIALDRDGYTRYYPYSKTTANSRPTTCPIVPYVSVTNAGSNCYDKYYSSMCGSSDYTTYPAYDARCRAWYLLGTNLVSPEVVGFQYPRIASSGSYVITATQQIRANQTASGHFYGELSLSFAADRLSASINTLTILDSGYIYLLDSSNVTTIILHPHAVKGCGTIRCAEKSFSDSEYQAFKAILDVLPLLESYTTKYEKGGESWRLVTSRVILDSVNYILVATVPNDEILAASKSIEETINYTVIVMIVVFVISMALFSALFLYKTKQLIVSVITPVQDLSKVLKEAGEENFSSSSLPTVATSLDLQVLLDACSNLLIALKFGNDSYARGNTQRAEEIYEQALALFKTTENMRGMGASYNNLASVALTKNQFQRAQELFQQAIECGDQKLKSLESQLELKDVKPDSTQRDRLKREIKNLKKIISDRRGNLVAAYLEAQQFELAFKLLENLLAEDKKAIYIKGCIVKQGNLGHYYLKQGEVTSAEKSFRGALEFIRNKELLSSLQGDNNALDEMEAVEAEQRAMFNMALLEDYKWTQVVKNDKQTSSFDKVESCYLESLTRLPVMHMSTTNNILSRLKSLYVQNSSVQHIAERDAFISKLIREHGFNVETHKSNATAGKKISFSIDYSGSMAGMKIRSAVTNLHAIFSDHINNQDSLMLSTFNGTVRTVLPLTIKQGNETTIKSVIDSLNAPNGGTALYDAIIFCLLEFAKTSINDKSSSSWIIVLTDGADTLSKVGLPELHKVIAAQKDTGLIVIGVGNDVEHDILTGIAQSAAKGHYFHAKADKDSIREVFSQVATMIQSQVMIEDY